MGVAAARTALASPGGVPARCGSPRSARRTSTRPTPPGPPALGSTRRGRPSMSTAGPPRGRRRAGVAPETALVVAADMRTGLPGSPDEAAGGDKAALLVGSGRRRPSWPRSWPGAAPPTSSSTAGARRATPARRCGRSASGGPLHGTGRPGLGNALRAGGLAAATVDRVVVTTVHPATPWHWVAAWIWATASPTALGDTVGFTGAAEPGLLLAPRWTRPRPARRSPWSCWPTAPTCWWCAPPRPWCRRTADPPPGGRSGRGQRAPAPTGRRWPGGAPSRSSRPAAPSRPGRRPPPRTGPRDWKFGLRGPQGDAGEVHLPPVLADETARTHGRRHRHHRHLRRRPAQRLLAVAARRVRRGRLRRGRPVPGRA